jgi:putative transposase
MKAYSADLRRKIVCAYENGEGTLDEIADIFSIGRRTAARYLKLHRTGGSLQPKPHGGGVPLSLTAEHLTAIEQRVAERGDVTLDELVAHLLGTQKLRVHRATVCRCVQRLGLSRKKKFGGFRKRRSSQRFVPPPSCSVRAQTTYLH